NGIAERKNQTLIEAARTMLAGTGPTWLFDIDSLTSSAQSKEHDDKTKKEDKRKNPVRSVTRYRDLNAQFEDGSENSSNEVNTASSIVPTIRQNSLNSTNTFSAAGPSNTAVSPTYGETSDIDAS
nr:hypothetical protein [Tanacetum cinerariifolium]